MPGQREGKLSPPWFQVCGIDGPHQVEVGHERGLRVEGRVVRRPLPPLPLRTRIWSWLKSRSWTRRRGIHRGGVRLRRGGLRQGGDTAGLVQCGPDFCPGHDDGEAGGLGGSDDVAEFGDVPLADGPEEEEEGHKSLVLGGCGDLFPYCQRGEEVLDVDFGPRLWRRVDPGGDEALGPALLGFLGAGTPVPGCHGHLIYSEESV